MKSAAENEVKKRIIIVITTSLLIALTLSLAPDESLIRPLAPLKNRFDTFFARSMRLMAQGGVYDTTDHYLKPLDIPRPSETLLKVMSELPPGDAVIFITAVEDDGSELIYRSISYLSWPRQIGVVRCGVERETIATSLTRATDPVKWLMFYQIALPPEFNQAPRKIGPRLILTPASELKEWKSYCSR